MGTDKVVNLLYLMIPYLSSVYMYTIKTNERELVSKISEWINEIIKRNNYPFASASNETGIKTHDTTKFGDLIIWQNRESNRAYSYIEIKPPFGAKENLETFKQKAIELNVKYAFTWDFQNLRAFKIKDNSVELVGTETEAILNNVQDWVRGDYQAKIKAYLGRILDELLSLNEKGKLTRYSPDKIYFVNFIRKAVSSLVPKFEKFLVEASRKNKKKHLIAEYAAKQGIAYPSDTEYYKLVARQTVYALVTKIIFYLTIKRYFNELPDIYQTDKPDLNRTLKIAFAKARQKDWQAVFEEGPIELLGIPEIIYDDIRLLLSEMQVYHFGELAEDVIGELFEEIIDPKERHRLGQYFTNEDLVDLIIGFTVQDKDGIYGDPTCGSGTFLIRLYDRFKHLSATKLKHNELLSKIWGIDIGKFPAELSTINLFRQNVSNYENFPRVIQSDIFDVYKGKVFRFPPPNASKSFSKVELPLPEFNGLVGNFPFIRQEIIEKKDKGYKSKLTKVIATEYFLSNPNLFKTKGLNERLIEDLGKASSQKFKKEIERYVDNKNIELRLSGQADIYTYIFIHTATLLAEKGTLAIITSNSWLDVSYGSVLKEFFLNNFNIKAILASWAEPWFEDAAVNTVVTVLEKSNKPNGTVKFVKLKKKLNELIPQRDLKLEAMQRWKRIDGIVDLIETAEYHKDIKKVTDKISSFENDEMRIRLIAQSELKKELNEKSELAKWGKYLRAPDVYFEILNKCKDKLVPLKEIADVRRGYTTGINEFFYLEEIKDKKTKNGLVYCKNARGWEGEIEKKYLKEVIKGSSKFKYISIIKSEIDTSIFLCNKTKKQLKKSGDINALKYIEWGEQQVNKSNIKYSEIKSVQGRKNWYRIPTVINDQIVYLAASRNRFITFNNKDQFLIDKRQYSINTKNKKDINNLLVILNSFINILHLEAYGFEVNNGNAKEFTVEEVQEMLIPNVKIDFDIKNIERRIILSIDKEVKQKDRKELDTAVLEALGLDAKEYLPRIYNGMTELVKERLELPKMRKKQKSQNVKVAYEEIKKAVIKDIIPNGIKTFPEAFYMKGNYDELEFETFSSNGKNLKAESFFNNFELKDETGKTIIETNSEIKAEFIELLSRKETYQIKIPKDDKITEQIIASYKQYIKNLKKDLEQNAHEKLHDWHLAEKMAKEILGEWGIV